LAHDDIVIPADTGAVLIVDLDAIADNFRLIRDRCPSARVGASVKANAYGLGVGPVTRTLAAAGCESFFVATLAEGVYLRKIGCDAEIIVLNGPEPGTGSIFRDARLTATLNSLAQIQTWAAEATLGHTPAWLHVDTGMNRLGLGADDVDAILAAPERISSLAIVGILSHLACADHPGHPMNAAQRTAFDAVRDRLEPLTGPVAASLANSPGVFLGPDFHYGLVRPGAALYGIRPLMDGPNPMNQVIDIYTKILQLRNVDTPMTVGYGAAHQVTSPRRIATLAAGYADGYPRAATARMEGNSMCAFIDGQAAPLVGRVSMDLITIDVTEIPVELCQPGQIVELMGPHVQVDEVADVSGTIAYEVLSRLGARLHVDYRGGVR
tara:strand:+ start:392 stop:1534 length:1143 start_codon:yes stop_codon:yes gene_type:complete